MLRNEIEPRGQTGESRRTIILLDIVPPLIGNAGIYCRINAAIDGRFRPEAAALKYGAHPYNLMPSAQRFKI